MQALPLGLIVGPLPPWVPLWLDDHAVDQQADSEAATAQADTPSVGHTVVKLPTRSANAQRTPRRPRG